jgi:two-component system cell cycle sensor histidine kinase/response regulator CckA
MTQKSVGSTGTAVEAGRRRPISLADGAALAAAALFLVAVLALAAPVLHSGKASWPALLLLIGVAGTSFLGVFAFAAAHRPEPRLDEPALEDLVAAMTEPAAVASVDGRTLCANDAWREAMGSSGRLPRNGADGQTVYAILRRAEAGEAAEGAFSGDQIVTAARIDGRRILVRLRAAQALAPAATSMEPASASETAAAAPSSLDAFAAASPFGACLLSGSDPFAAVMADLNPALNGLTDGAAKPGVPFSSILDPAGIADLRERLTARPAGPVEVRLAAKQSTGQPRIAHLYLASDVRGRVTAFLLDVSDQKQLELQLAQNQKMQAIGQLAGGVAHDFNNLLTAIQLRLDELLHRHPVGDPSYEALTEIRQTGVRAADLVRKLLAFSRKQTVQRETLPLGELISEFEVLLRRLLREDVRLVTDYGRDLPFVRADKSQLETAVMNLAVNARDALRSHGTHDGGPAEVRIQTKRLTRDDAVKLGFPAAPAEGCAMIEVADNGPGIPPDAMAKIFEPFFTTKPVGEGTGLGLAMVYGVVKQADGWIHVDSAPGKGAAFRIFLPVYVPPAADASAPAKPAKAKPAARDLSGAGRILFVEDEDVVRGVAARLLRARGYEVIEAADGEEALILAEENAGKIDLLISDVIMPGLDGPTLLKKARKYLDGAPVMFISGYAEAEFSDLLEGETGVTFLAKPLDIKVLAERVKQQLQAA